MIIDENQYDRLTIFQIKPSSKQHKNNPPLQKKQTAIDDKFNSNLNIGQ